MIIHFQFKYQCSELFMNIRSFIGTACAAIAIFFCFSASAQGTGETVTPNFNRAIPNVPGKSLVAVVVDYASGSFSAARTRPIGVYLRLRRLGLDRVASERCACTRLSRRRELL